MNSSDLISSPSRLPTAAQRADGRTGNSTVMQIKHLAAAAALVALAVLGATAVSGTGSAVAGSKMDPTRPSYVKPQVPVMKTGDTVGETTTTTSSRSKT